MKKNLSAIATIVALAITGCTVQPRTQLDAPVAITTQVEGSSLLDRNASPSTTIRVQFEDNAELATLIENDLISRGLQRAGLNQPPDVDVVIQSVYRFQKGLDTGWGTSAIVGGSAPCRRLACRTR